MTDPAVPQKDVQRAVAEVREAFRALDWDIAAAEAALNTFLEGRGMPRFDPRRDSIHWLALVAAIHRSGARRVLEIGTFTGFTAALIAAVAPAAEVVTVDLPDGAPAYESYVATVEAGREAFERRRDDNLGAETIRFLRSDSFLLSPDALGRFDVIWVDGWHRFPNIAWDVYLAYHLCNPGGFVLLDDIEFRDRGEAYFGGEDSGRVARYLQGLGIDAHFLLKRLAAKYLVNDRENGKFVMVIEKT